MVMRKLNVLSQRMELESPKSYAKIKEQSMKDLNVSPEIIKLLEEHRQKVP